MMSQCIPMNDESPEAQYGRLAMTTPYIPTLAIPVANRPYALVRRSPLSMILCPTISTSNLVLK